jgi:hypothetical protein
VRETFCLDEGDQQPFYRATEGHPEIFPKWRPSIFMPRWASRITLEITSVRVERLGEITEEDAEKEGIELKGYKKWRPPDTEIPYTRRDHFEALWDSINGKKHPWASSPWVWVIEFKRV